MGVVECFAPRIESFWRFSRDLRAGYAPFEEILHLLASFPALSECHAHCLGASAVIRKRAVNPMVPTPA